MANTYNKRMSNYQSMLPVTPFNFHLIHRNIRGGDLTNPTTPITPIIKPITQASNSWVNTNPLPRNLSGVPSYLYTHPNKYSLNKSQIMVYDSYQHFLESAFYKKYQSKLVVVKVPMRFQQNDYSGWGSDMWKQYSQKWRIIFVLGNIYGRGKVEDTGDYQLQYLDVVDMDEYLQVLQSIYDSRDTIVPSEMVGMLRRAIHNKELVNQFAITKSSYNSGRNSVLKEQADAKAKEEANSSVWDTIWGGIKTIAPIALSLI